MSNQLELVNQLNQALDNSLQNINEIERRVTTQVTIISNLSQAIEGVTLDAFENFNQSIVSFNQNLSAIVSNIREAFSLDALSNLCEELEEHIGNTRRELGNTSEAIEELSQVAEEQTNNANTAASAASDAAHGVANSGMQVRRFSRQMLSNVSSAQGAIGQISGDLESVGEAADSVSESVEEMQRRFITFKEVTKGLLKSLKSVIGAVAQLFKTILTLPAQVAKMAAQAGNKLRVDLVEVIGNAKQEFKEFFDMNSNIGQGIQKLGKVGSGQLATFQVAGSRMVKLFGFGTQGIVTMMSEFKEILNAMGPFAEIFGNTIGDTEEQIEFFIMMKRAFGLSTEDYAYYAQDAAKNMQTLNDRIFEMGKTVFNVADSYSLDRKKMSLNFQKLRKQIVHFDHLTDEELAVTTARITQLGVKIEDVAAIFDKFSTFEDAAKSIALLSQTFGMNLDAMDLIKAEKPEEIFEMFRNTMMETGRSFEDLNRFEKQLMANQTGLSAETLKSIMNFRTAGLTYEQAVERANQNKPEKKQMKALKELRSAIKEIQKVMAFDSPFEAFFKGLKANTLASGEFSKTLMTLGKGYESIYNYAAGLKVDTFEGILQPVRMIVDILSSLVNSKGFKKGLVSAVETIGTLVSGTFGIGKGIRETYNIVASLGRLKINKKTSANLKTILNKFSPTDLKKLGIGQDYLKKISKKSVQDQIKSILIKIRKNVMKDKKLTKAHDSFIAKFQAQYSALDTQYNQKYNLTDHIKDGLNQTSSEMTESAGTYMGLAGTIAGAILKGAMTVLTAGLEFLSESLKPIADEADRFNNTGQSRNALEKIFNWDAGEMGRMITDLGNAFIGLFTTGNNFSIMGTLISAFGEILFMALSMVGSLLKGMFIGIFEGIFGKSKKNADKLYEDASVNQKSGSSIGISSAYNELKFDAKKYDKLIEKIQKIDKANRKPLGARGKSLGITPEYDATSKKKAGDVIKSAGIKEDDQKRLQADLIAQAEGIHNELKASKGQTKAAYLASMGKLSDTIFRMKELKQTMMTQDDWFGDDFKDPFTGKQYEMSSEQLTAELLKAHSEMKAAKESITQGKAYKDVKAEGKPGGKFSVSPINSKTDIQTNGQAGFMRGAYSKFEKISGESSSLLEVTNYNNNEGQGLMSFNNNVTTKVIQSASTLCKSLEKLDKTLVEREDDEAAELLLTDENIVNIFQRGCGLGGVDILSDAKFGQGRTILAPISTTHPAMQPARVNSGQRTSYNTEHSR